MDAQRADCREYARLNGLEVVGEITELGTGVQLDRPKLNELLNRAQSGDIKAVIVSSPDRISRCIEDVEAFTRMLDQCGVQLLFVNEASDVGDTSMEEGEL